MSILRASLSHDHGATYVHWNSDGHFVYDLTLGNKIFWVYFVDFFSY